MTKNTLSLNDYLDMANKTLPKFVAINTHSTVTYEDIAKHFTNGELPDYTADGKRIIYKNVDDDGIDVTVFVENTGKEFGIKVLTPFSTDSTGCRLNQTDKVSPLFVTLTKLFSQSGQLKNKHMASAFAQFQESNAFHPNYPVIGTSGADSNDISINGFDFVYLLLTKGAKGRSAGVKEITPIKVKFMAMPDVFEKLRNDPNYAGMLTEVIQTRKGKNDSEVDSDNE